MEEYMQTVMYDKIFCSLFWLILVRFALPAKLSRETAPATGLIHSVFV